jgi:hypothetical protein
MFARMVFFQFKPENVGDAARLFRRSVIPGAKRQKGYRGACFLTGRKAGQVIAMTFWRNEKDALASEENLFFQEQLVKFMPYFANPPLRESGEVAVHAMVGPAQKKMPKTARRPAKRKSR